MDGGVYKTQGADTCVYIPQVACAKKGRRTTLRKAPGGTALISRITRDEYELKVQKVVDKTLKKLAVAGHGSSQFFNLADSACTPEFKPEDMKANCTVRALQGHKDLINLVTPVQGVTLLTSIQTKSKPDALIKSSLKGLMVAMARLNAEMVTHSDSHFNNLGWQGDQLVIFDWGRGTTDRKSFKHWVNKYLFIWPLSEKADWKTYSQHTLQFALLDEAANTNIMKKSGVYETIASVWDTLGLLGPARASGVVSEEKSAAFMKEVFASIKADPKKKLTDRLINTLIPALFGDPPAIHPVVAERPMPPAEAAAVSRIIPVPAAAAPPAPAPAPAKPPVAPPAPVKDDKKLEDIKDACRKLLAPAGGARVQKGGDFLAGGADTLVWNQKPTAEEKASGGPAWLGLPIGWDAAALSIPPVFDEITKYGDAVVRMILLKEGEMDVHRVLKSWASKDENAFVRMHLNTFIGGTPYTTHTSVVLKATPGAAGGGPGDSIKHAHDKNVEEAEVQHAAAVKANSAADIAMWTKIKAALAHSYFSITDVRSKIKVKDAAVAAGSYAKWYGLPTIRQQPDLYTRDPIYALRALVDIAQALVHTDGFWIQQDLHAGNMASMLDDTPVIHDYGRMKLRDYDLKELGATSATIPTYKNENILRNILPGLLHDFLSNTDYMKSFSQFYYLVELLTKLSEPPPPNNTKDLAQRVIWTRIRLNESSYTARDPPAGYTIKNRRKLDRKSFDHLTYIAYQLASEGSLFAENPPQVVKDGRMTETPISHPELIKTLRELKQLDEAEDAKVVPDPTLPDRGQAVRDNKWEVVKSIDAATPKPSRAHRETYLRSLYKDPVYETRYHHLARIWDLLSVMKVIVNVAAQAHVEAFKAKNQAAADKYEHIRAMGSGTARMLMRNVAADRPFAVRSEVERVVLKECCVAIVQDLKRIDPAVRDFVAVSPSNGPAVGKAYWDAANIERSDPKAPAAAAAAAAAPGGGAMTGGVIEFEAEIEAEKQEDIKLAKLRESRRNNKLEQAKKDFEGEVVNLEHVEESLSPERTTRKYTDADAAADIKAKDAEIDAEMNDTKQGGKLTRRRRLPRLV